MGSGCHQQKVAGDPGQELSQVVTLGISDLTTEVTCRHLVGFVADYEVPFTVWRLELLLDGLVAG